MILSSFTSFENVSSLIQILGSHIGSSEHIFINMLIIGAFVFINYFILIGNSNHVAMFAARFSLDDYPGQILSINNNLNAQLIDQKIAFNQKYIIWSGF